VMLLALRDDWGRLPEADRAEWQVMEHTPGAVLARLR